jgi:hypothetical protein
MVHPHVPHAGGHIITITKIGGFEPPRMYDMRVHLLFGPKRQVHTPGQNILGSKFLGNSGIIGNVGPELHKTYYSIELRESFAPSLGSRDIPVNEGGPFKGRSSSGNSLAASFSS